MLTKPWNLYVLRHSALIQKSKILKEHTLRDHAGWSTASKMPQVYIHYFGNESSNSLLEVYGIKKEEEKNNYHSTLLKPKQCPNCNESNKADSKFCIGCRMILTYDAYTETIENNQLLLHEKYQEKMEEMNNKLILIMSMIQQNPQLAQIKPEALIREKK